MNVPVLQGHVARRLLVNYRVDPACLAPLIPAPLRPMTWRGWGIAGLCLLRLEAMRPEGWPAWMGTASENAAHRVAVTWEAEGRTRTGVYVWRRDTDAGWTRRLGGRLFPGRLHAARIEAAVGDGRWDLRLRGEDVDFDLKARGAAELPAGSVFPSMDEATAFFQGGQLGWSEGRRGLEGMRVALEGWNLRPLAVDHLRASFFVDRKRFPEGRIAFDSAFLMENLPVRWLDAGGWEAPCRC